MDIDLTPEQKQFEKDVYTYLRGKVLPEMEEELFTNMEGDGPVAREVIRQLGSEGWMGVDWPKEYGGQERTPIEPTVDNLFA